MLLAYVIVAAVFACTLSACALFHIWHHPGEIFVKDPVENAARLFVLGVFILNISIFWPFVLLFGVYKYARKNP